jgi:predicted transcriptional regulator
LSIALLVCHQGNGIDVLVLMLSIYELTPKGRKTRSQLIDVLHQQNGLTRNELVEKSGLSYEQVRRHTQNLVSEGRIKSAVIQGQRRYYVQIVAMLLVAVVPVCYSTIKNDAVRESRYELTDS